MTNELAQVQDQAVLNFDEAILSKLPKLSVIAEKSGYDVASALVAKVLSEISQILAFPVAVEMIEAAADIICQKWNDVNINDLKLFKYKVVSGEIGGQLYRLDARIFCQMFSEYYSKRLDEFESLLERKNTTPDDVPLLPMAEILKKRNPEPDKKTWEALQKMKQQAQDVRDREAWQKRSKNMDLEMMCKAVGVDYYSLLSVAKADCEEVFDSTGAMPFDAYYKNHIQRIQIEARKDSSILLAYQR